MLKIQNLQVAYGGIQALRGIDMEVPDGKIVTLIGANGAGKSTTLRTISGLVKAKAGAVSRVIYTLVGLAGIWCITMLFRETEPVEGEANT